MNQNGSGMDHSLISPLPLAIPVSVQNEIKEMLSTNITEPAASQPDPEEPKLEFFRKLYNDLPVISSSIDLTCSVYNKVRGSNCISYRMLKTAERTAGAVKNSTNPIVNIFMSPLMKIDFLLCTTLDFVENRVPVIKQTPNEIYENTKWMIKYVCTGQCALNCVCKTGMYGLNKANNLKNLVLCKTTDENTELFEDAVEGFFDKLNDPTSPFHQPIVPLMPDYRFNH